ncbi:MAG: APC family permease [Fimbriimonadaceae bacterium]|nr:APC family permease [Fimbriimonadaceae bacterium]QYK56025.1 MAG: APC family permease [Fimbriimonadaceae bacterium]
MTGISRLKRILLGRPIATKRAHHEKLIVPFGLAVFASDALSSVAYASEEIMLVLVLAGPVGLQYLLKVSAWLGVLMLIVGFSYFQTIQAYPKGGGTYIVSSENLGKGAAKIAGASLLIDYVLTVAVSVSSGIAAIVSMAPGVQPFAVPIGVAAIALLGLANLRGAKESGALFAIPTYFFVVMMLALIGTSLMRGAGSPHIPPQGLTAPAEGWHAINVLLLLRAFAASCTALTGTEAIADGVPAFKDPAPRNAGLTLILMVGLLLTMFLGVSWSAMHYGIVPMAADAPGYQTVVAQLASLHFGDGSWLFRLTLVATATILFLAANTAYADFPRLASFVARDNFLPRQLMSLGDRLVFQNGIVLLSLFAVALIVFYNADTHSLIPLYAMGVFISFTLSQAGMAMKLWTERKQALAEGATGSARKKAWQMSISGFGALVTFIVTGILLVTKWEEGAYLIVIALAAMLFLFQAISKHYKYLANELNLAPDDVIPKYKTAALLLVPRLHKGILSAIAYARASTADVRALHVTLDGSSAESLKKAWEEFGEDLPLVILDSPYRSLVDPVTDYVDQMIAEDPDLVVTVIVPQAVPKYPWHAILHNNAAAQLKTALASRKNVVVTNVRYFLR